MEKKYTLRITKRAPKPRSGRMLASGERPASPAPVQKSPDWRNNMTIVEGNVSHAIKVADGAAAVSANAARQTAELAQRIDTLIVSNLKTGDTGERIEISQDRQAIEMYDAKEHKVLNIHSGALSVPSGPADVNVVLRSLPKTEYLNDTPYVETREMCFADGNVCTFNVHEPGAEFRLSPFRLRMVHKGPQKPYPENRLKFYVRMTDGSSDTDLFTVECGPRSVVDRIYTPSSVPVSPGSYRIIICMRYKLYTDEGYEVSADFMNMPGEISWPDKFIEISEQGLQIFQSASKFWKITFENGRFVLDSSKMERLEAGVLGGGNAEGSNLGLVDTFTFGQVLSIEHRGTGHYFINHNIGHRRYTLTLSVLCDNVNIAKRVFWNIWTRGENYCEIVFYKNEASGTNKVDANFDVTITGDRPVQNRLLQL